MPAPLRKVLFWIHLAIGVSVALPVFVMCVTGALMTYERQIEAWGDRWSVKAHESSKQARTLDLEGLIQKIREARGVDPSAITVFADNTQPVTIELDGKPARVLHVDADSGKIAGDTSRKVRLAFQKIRAWHLALGVSGSHHQSFRVLVNATNLVALFLAILGLLLWIPKHWSWKHLRPIVMFRSGLAGRARDFNWHNAIGIWSAGPLLIIVWTGAALSYGWARQLTDRLINAGNTEWAAWHRADSAAFAPKFETQENVAPDARPVDLDALLARAKAQMPEWKAITIVVPQPDSKLVYFTIDTSGDGIRDVSALGLDRAGKVVSFIPGGADGVSPTSFVRYGHTGEAWGVAGQTIAGVASLGGALLVWTGVALSLRRLRSWSRRNEAGGR